jgi:hypothetical protein
VSINQRDYETHEEKAHLQVQKNSLYKCDLCQYSSMKKESLLTHIIHNHNEIRILQKFSDIWCEELAKKSDNIERLHWNIYFAPNIPEVEDKLCQAFRKYAIDTITWRVPYQEKSNTHTNDIDDDWNYCDDVNSRLTVPKVKN